MNQEMWWPILQMKKNLHKYLQGAILVPVMPGINLIQGEQ